MLRSREKPKIKGVKGGHFKRCGNWILAEVTASLQADPDSLLPDGERLESIFYSVTEPEISISHYLLRIGRYAHVLDEVYGHALDLLKRLAAKPYLSLNEFNVHRLLTTAVLLAAKWGDIRCYSNAHYARVRYPSRCRNVSYKNTALATEETKLCQQKVF